MVWDWDGQWREHVVDECGGDGPILKISPRWLSRLHERQLLQKRCRCGAFHPKSGHSVDEIMDIVEES